MTTVSVTQLNANDEITAAGANLPHNQLAAVINGNLDDNNISGLSGTKITTGTLPTTALDSTVKSGWLPITGSISAVTYNGNRSYSLTTSSDNSGAISPGMRLRTTRTVAAPTYMGGAFNGTNHYFTKATPSGTLGTVTNNFTLMGWAEPTAYVSMCIAGRGDSTTANGLYLFIDAFGRPTVQVSSGGAGNYRYISAYQSVALNKKVHVAATWSSGTVAIYIDGISVPVATAATGGTAPTTAGTGGDFSIGRFGANNGGYFTGYISGVGVFDAVLSAATIRSYASQALAGNETNCIGAWTLNNTPNDQSSAANNLTATNSVGYTSGRSPYATQASGTATGSLDYAIVQTVSASTLVVQVPEGCTIPTSGGISAVAYSVQKSPYGFPGQKGKWQVASLLVANNTTGSPVTGTWYEAPGLRVTVPIGEWSCFYDINAIAQRSGSGTTSTDYTISTTSAAAGFADSNGSILDDMTSAGNTTTIVNVYRTRTDPISLSSQTSMYFNYKTRSGSQLTSGVWNTDVGGISKHVYENAYV